MVGKPVRQDHWMYLMLFKGLELRVDIPKFES